MFLTTDRQVIEEKCRAEGFEPIGTDGGGLRLISTQPVIRHHPETGEPVWHNHVTTFHPSQAQAEYRRIHRLRPGARSLLFWQLARCLGVAVSHGRLPYHGPRQIAVAWA